MPPHQRRLAAAPQRQQCHAPAIGGKLRQQPRMKKRPRGAGELIAAEGNGARIQPAHKPPGGGFDKIAEKVAAQTAAGQAPRNDFYRIQIARRGGRR